MRLDWISTERYAAAVFARPFDRVVDELFALVAWRRISRELFPDAVKLSMLTPGGPDIATADFAIRCEHVPVAHDRPVCRADEAVYDAARYDKRPILALNRGVGVPLDCLSEELKIGLLLIDWACPPSPAPLQRLAAVRRHAPVTDFADRLIESYGAAAGEPMRVVIA